MLEDTAHRIRNRRRILPLVLTQLTFTCSKVTIKTPERRH